MEFLLGNDIIRLTYDYIEENNKRFYFKDIIDFDYSHSYYNNMGGNSLRLYFTNGNVLLGGYIDRTIFGTNKAEKQKIIDKVEIIANTILPLVAIPYIKNNVKRILEGRTVKIWKINFEKNHISMYPRMRLWHSEVRIPYEHASIRFKHSELGVFGQGGRASFFKIKDLRTNKEYNYSKNGSFQPTQGEYTKISNIFHEIKRVKSTL